MSRLRDSCEGLFSQFVQSNRGILNYGQSIGGSPLFFYPRDARSPHKTDVIPELESVKLFF